MVLSVQENVRRCFEKFGARVIHAAPTRPMKWRSPSYHKPTLHPVKDKKAAGGEDRSGPALAD
jgi:hypothetical protein